ncbi:lipopolysaccharide biosynthesis protein [Paenibacillus psychroresistens]|uniref:Lipopolysaccharide biosynthesis protein n=1 Tax=Paenibacillus psychroresistens TaxID=1778678 RepID=A0A6B8RFZ5_9BACL|nr:Wzz/FepE/Etk N-terminal domain-containing protein [Paenibacillus psychroresistens]QGQ94348.1 lipopolysaccharide biosynthesis protein [Paenibacillus psychroresistens]
MELEIKEYVRILIKRSWIIICIMLLITSITAVYSFKYIQPVYEASVKMIVTKSPDLQGIQIIDNGSIDANIKLINTYKEIIKTSAIMDKVVSNYPDIGLDAIQLIEMVNVNSANESQLMTISVEDESYPRAVQIVNATAEVFRNQISLLMKIDNVTVLNEANPAIKPAPVNQNPMMNIVISLIVSFMLAMGIVIILEYLDDTIKTEDDIKKYFGLSTLGMISKVKGKELESAALVKAQRQAGDPLHVSPNI